MPVFLYKAINEGGELFDGELQAADRDAVIDWLRSSGHTPIRAVQSSASVSATNATRNHKKLRQPLFKQRRQKIDTSRLTRDISTLLSAGVNLERSLDMLVTLAENATTSEIITELRDTIRGGSSLADALEAHPAVFSKFYISMIRSGEAGGNLGVTLGRLAEFLDRYNVLRNQVKTALIYPSVLISITLFSVLVLVTFVVPQFASMFADMGQELPLPTRIVIGLGEAVSNYGLLFVLAMLALFAYARHILKRPDILYRWHRWLLQIPLLGDLITQVEVTIFARTLGSLLTSGVPLLTALGIVNGTLRNQALRQALSTVAEAVTEGQGMAQPMTRCGLFPPLATHLIQVGEETGQLESTLSQLADVYDRETGTAIQRLLALLEPVLIIGLGLIVGGIIMSILVAVLSVNDLAF